MGNKTIEDKVGGFWGRMKKGAVAVLGAGVLFAYGVSGCGDTTEVHHHYNNGNGNGSGKCKNLCERVWLDCEGLPDANYWFGSSYNNRLAGCPDFLDGVNKSPYAEGMNESVNCIIDSSYTCKQLEEDWCEMDEGDLFENYKKYQ